MSEFQKAIQCSQNAIERVRNQTNKHFELSIFQIAGRVYQMAGEYENANYWFTEADRVYKEVGKVVDNFELFKFWAETLNSLGKFEEAYQKLMQFTKQKEELHKLNKIAELNEESFNLEVERLTNINKQRQELIDLCKKKYGDEMSVQQYNANNYFLPGLYISNKSKNFNIKLTRRKKFTV